MELKIKQLKLNNLIFVPQTTAEAVLVKHNNLAKRLDVVLALKIEEVSSVDGSGVKVLMTSPTTAVITHTNEIEPNANPKPLLIQHDNRGHIVKTVQMGKLDIVVNNSVHISHTGESDQVLLMGDDFTLDENNKIKLNWNNL